MASPDGKVRVGPLGRPSRRPEEKQHHAHRHGRDDQAPLAVVQRGREERPGLVGHHRRGEQEADDEGELERDQQRLGRAREHEPAVGQEWRNRALEQADHVHPVHDEPPGDRAQDDRQQAVEDPPAQFLEMIEERHLAA
jgi:hypothetical protein